MLEKKGSKNFDDNSDRLLLILDDDKPFRERLGKAMDRRGFKVTSTETTAEAIAVINKTPPTFAAVSY